MKKLAILLLAAVLTVTLACAVAATAAEEPLYAAAADGDLLYTVDFRGDDRFSPQRSVNESPEEIEITPYADGSGVSLKSAAGFAENEKYWGGIISGLTADSTTNYTMMYKIRMNGKNGKNNAIGIGGLAWNLESTEKNGVRFLNNYGCYKSQFPDGEEVKQRTGLSVDDCRISDYVYDIANAIEDADGFITCRIDFNGPSDNYTAYCLTGTGWTYIEDQSMFEPFPEFAEVYSDAKYVALYIYTYWDVIDVDVKDVKWFKGINLTDEQLAAAAPAAVPAGPAAEEPLYAAAADGDLLYTVDFRGDDRFSPVPSDFAVDYTTYTPTEDGSGIHVTGNEGFDEEWSFWGSPIAGLNADKTTCYTMTYKVRINGESGKNNSIGIGGLAWNLDAPETTQWRFFENYGNYNSVFPEEDTPNRTALSVSAHKYGDYVNGIENADEDRDGYLTCRLDFNGPENTVKAYCMADGEWTLLEEQQMGEPKEDYAGAYSEYKAVSLYLYTYYEVVDADVKDVKWYKGVNLTDEQLAGQEEVTSPASDAGDNTEVPSRGLADVNTAADGKNIITAYEFVSGTNGNGGEGPENLWDGNTATKFCTGEFPIESIAKLDGVYDITGFTMATANDNADWNGRSPSAWTISVSADGENWTELASGDDSFFEETNFTYYVGEGTASGVSYVKFNAEGAPSGCFQVSEVTLFGDKAVSLDEFLEAKEEAPNTFDFGVIAAVAAVISLGGFAVSKKRK